MKNMKFANAMIGAAIAMFVASSGKAGCPADFNGDGFVTGADFDQFVGAFEAGDASADFDGDGFVSGPDFDIFVHAFESGCDPRPDLVITSVQARSFIVPGCSFDADIVVANIGEIATSQSCNIGAWLSLDPFLGGDEPVGIRPISLAPGLEPGQSRTYTLTNLQTTGQTVLGTQYLLALVDLDDEIDEQNEQNNLRGDGVSVRNADVAVTAVSVSDNCQISGQQVPVTVTLHNNGACTINVPVNVSIGSNSSVCWHVVGPLMTQTFSCEVLAPNGGDCGAQQQFVVTARATLDLDSDRSNDLASASICIVDPYWDLRFTICEAPASANRGGTAHWKVCVTNAGNISSPAVCSRTGICADCGNYTQCIGGCGTPNVFTFNVASLAPGQSREFNFTSNICSNAFPGQQFIQAGVDTFSGCSDGCGAGNNICRSIVIH